MVERRRLVAARGVSPAPGGNYFEDDTPKHFISSGCTVLNCVLTGNGYGAWPLGRVVNIVGDKSTGKTLLAIEACANFAQQFPKGKIYYREAESAFDLSYAGKLGLPTDRVDFGDDGLDTQWETIEDIFEDLQAVVKRHEEKRVPGLYIVDSLDALTSRASLNRKVGQDSFNLEKQKILSQMFSELCGRFRAANVCVIIISQVRDIIGFVVGEKHRRSGGKSLDFYATQALWLKHMKTLTQTIGGVKRAVGIRIKAKCKKNKIGAPFLECEFVIRFGYGIDDVAASAEWLAEVKMLPRLGLTGTKMDNYLDETAAMPLVDYQERAQQVRQVVSGVWQEVADRFTPPRQKYA